MTGCALVLDDVSKRFGTIDALRAVSLSVGRGESVALLGHNGAGKTTLFRLCLGFIRPDAGTMRVAGTAPGSATARRAIAYLPESVVFQKALTGREVLRLFAHLKGETASRADAILEKIGLAAAAGRRVGEYSKGMRQRLGLAQALLARPTLMCLDEPTSGLDPLSRQEFYDILREVAAGGCAVVLSSHGLSEIEARTDRIVILRAGRTVADAPLADLQREAALPIRIQVRATPEAVGSVADRLGGRRVNGQTIELQCPPGEKIAQLRAIGELGTDVTDFDVAMPTLDEVYRHFSTREARR